MRMMIEGTNQKVWKFPLPYGPDTAIEMPLGARILTAQAHNTPGADIALWALVDPDMTMQKRRFMTVGTGHPLDTSYVADLNYIDTVQIGGGVLVFHVFELV